MISDPCVCHLDGYVGILLPFEAFNCTVVHRPRPSSDLGNDTEFSSAVLFPKKVPEQGGFTVKFNLSVPSSHSGWMEQPLTMSSLTLRYNH